MYLEDLAKKSFYFCNTFNVKIEHGHCFIMKYTHNKKEINISQSHHSDTTSVDIVVFFPFICKQY